MDSTKNLPSIKIIKSQLKPISPIEKWMVVINPLLTISLYFIFCWLKWYSLAFLSLCYLSFVTYGSCCHDLVHANFGMSRKLCNFWLSFIEILLMRSGTTYRVTHLNHHQFYPDFDKDPEGRASYYTLFRTLLEGPVFHPKLILWTLKNGDSIIRFSVLIEIFFIMTFWILGLLIMKTFSALIIYQIIVTLGSWIIPLITSYLVHIPQESGAIRQTKIFRGFFFRIVALDHLYHLEHHLFPQVPHCRWPQLATILNPYFQDEQLTAIRFESKESSDFSLN